MVILLVFALVEEVSVVLPGSSYPANDHINFGRCTAIGPPKLIGTVKQLKRLVLGRREEKAVRQCLDALRKSGNLVFHDTLGDGFKTDHIIIVRHGVFTVETKAHSKPSGKAQGAA